MTVVTKKALCPVTVVTKWVRKILDFDHAGLLGVAPRALFSSFSHLTVSSGFGHRRGETCGRLGSILWSTSGAEPHSTATGLVDQPGMQEADLPRVLPGRKTNTGRLRV